MFTFEEYMTGWGVYLLSVIGLLLVFWRITRNLPWFYLKQCLRLIAVTLLLMPATIEGAPGLMAPAWVKAVLQLIFYGAEGFAPVAQFLLMAILVALLIYLILLIAQRLYLKWRHPES